MAVVNVDIILSKDFVANIIEPLFFVAKFPLVDQPAICLPQQETDDQADTEPKLDEKTKIHGHTSSSQSESCGDIFLSQVEMMLSSTTISTIPI